MREAEASYWAVLSDEQMSNGWPYSLLNDEQMSNKVRVEHQPVNGRVTQMIYLISVVVSILFLIFTPICG